MYSKNIFFKFSFLFALLALCLHAEKLQAQNESVHFKYELVDNGLNILGSDIKTGHVDIPDSLPCEDGKMYPVLVIRNISFKNSGISSVRLPKHLVEIQGYAFTGCKNLKSIEFPPSLKEIGREAFSYSGLTHVTIPNTIKTLGMNSFGGCDSLKSVDVDCRVVGNGAFIECKALRTIHFGEHVETLVTGAFALCSSLQSVVLHDNITEIGANAFLGCTSLKSAEVKAEDALFGEDVFKNCTSLVKLSLPSTVSNPAKLCSNTAYVRNMYAGGWVISFARLRAPRGLVKIYVTLNKDATYTAKSSYSAKFNVNYPNGRKGPGSLAVAGVFSGTWELNSDGTIKMSNGRSKMTVERYMEGNRSVRSYVTSGIYGEMERQLHIPFSPEGKNLRNQDGALMERQATSYKAQGTSGKRQAASRKPVRKR
ncbi:leucine-rich repeat domain-containing protein [Prevotella sp.]|uniref:leucine-rich repeat domain-containing protein n=1 Tax=Prevotella sp. TaxID=59823 RepID=UPI0025EBE72A|nr:leucine-rich repeat domain-containing protein [Prevotella sp.]